MKRRFLAVTTLGALLAFSGGARAQEEEPEAPAEQAEAEAEAAEVPEPGPEEEAAEPEGEEAEAEAETEVDPASDPPAVAPVPDDEPQAWISGRWRNELHMTQRSRMVNLGNGRYALRGDRSVYPFYSYLSLRAEDVGVEGLSIHFQGWTGVDLADQWFQERVVAEPTYLYVQYRTPFMEVRAGRQMIFSGVARGIKLDGLYASYEAPFNLGLEAYGGLVALPNYGPEWTTDGAGENRDFGLGGTDWREEGDLGDFAVGGRAYYRVLGRVNAGVSASHQSSEGETLRQLLGADAHLSLVEWLAVLGDFAWDLQASAIQEANAAVDVYPLDELSFSLDYRHADPALYLSRLSIFSVFSNQAFDSVGATVRVRPIQPLVLHAGYHQNFYGYIDSQDDPDDAYSSEIDVSYEVEAGGRYNFGDKGGIVRLDLRRFTQDADGVNQVRLGARVPTFYDPIFASANAYFDVYDEEINDTRIGLMGDLGLFWRQWGWSAGGVVTAAMTPYAEGEIRGLVKVGYDFDVTFSERRRP